MPLPPTPGLRVLLTHARQVSTFSWDVSPEEENLEDACVGAQGDVLLRAGEGRVACWSQVQPWPCVVGAPAGVLLLRCRLVPRLGESAGRPDGGLAVLGATLRPGCRRCHQVTVSGSCAINSAVARYPACHQTRPASLPAMLLASLSRATFSGPR